MYKLLRKLNSGSNDFSEEELAYLAPHLNFFIKRDNMAVVEKLLSHPIFGLQNKNYFIALLNRTENLPSLAMFDKVIETIKGAGGDDLLQTVLRASCTDHLTRITYDNRTDLMGRIIELFKDTDTLIKTLDNNGSYFGGPGVFNWVCKHEDTRLLDILIDQVRTAGSLPALRTIIERDNYKLLRFACINGHSNVIDRIFDLVREVGGDEMARKALEAQDYEAFHTACGLSHPELVSGLIAEAQKIGGDLMVCTMIESQGRSLFKHISSSNPNASAMLETLFLLAEKYGGKDWADGLLTNNNFEALDYLALGKIPVLDTLVKLARGIDDDNTVRTMLARYEHKILSQVISHNGNDLAALDRVATMALEIGGRDMLVALLKHDKFETFRSACEYGLTEHVEKLASFATMHGEPDLLKTMIESLKRQNRYHSSFVGMCSGKHVGTVEKILELAKVATGDETLVSELLKLNNYAAFRMADEKNIGCLALSLLAATPEDMKGTVMEKLRPSWKTVIDNNVPKSLLWQILGGSNDRWRAMTHQDAPDICLSQHSPFRFKPKLYAAMLPLMRIACELEEVYIPDAAIKQAYKLSVLFANEQEAERYLNTYIERWHDARNQPVYNACRFDLPKSGLWEVTRWKDLVLKFGPPISKYLGLAPNIESILKDGVAFPQSPSDVQALATQNLYLKGREHPAFAEEASKYGLSEYHFNTGLAILNAPGRKTEDRLPNIFIDGNDIGCPDYYMEKLPLGDPRGLLLGEISNCCQSIGSDGSECAIHGTTSHDGSFYVWKLKKGSRLSDADPIIAQSWAWIGSDSKIVFDSYERLSKDFNWLAQPFTEQFAHDVSQVKKGEHFRGVRLGKGGNSPKLPFNLAAEPSKPIDYRGYRDSHEQYEIPAVNHKMA